MDFVKLAVDLQAVVKTGSVFYLATEPGIIDFTESCDPLVILYHKDTQFSIKIDIKNLFGVISLIKTAFFDNENITLLTWGIKSLFSYIRFYTKADFEYKCQIFDLKIMERYFGVESKAPKSLSEAVERIKIISKSPVFDKLKLVYNRVHVPLMRVLPRMETRGILDLSVNKILYSYYEIEGQSNGRLRCHEAYRNAFVPHTVGVQNRVHFRPNGLNTIFMHLDYKNMEVSMLEWLTKDEKLKEILDSEQDFYKAVFKLVTGVECDNEAKRNMCKTFFLPVIFGMQHKNLAEELSISVTSAEKLISRIYSLFPKSLKWIEDFQNSENCSNPFGRTRVFDKLIQKRNFIVQSSAALACCEKLIKLIDGLDGIAEVAFCVHDGYYLYVELSKFKLTRQLAIELLESDSELFPGLRLKVKCKTGTNLEQLNEE